jgi:predicted nucleic acid-binding Zn ribbon protein
MSSRHSNNYCLHCGNEITSGRRDKKFCNTKCKNFYHSDDKREETNFFLQTEQILRKNHRIVQEFFQGGDKRIRCTVENLQILGFKPQFCTGVLNKKAVLYNVQFFKRSRNEYEFIKLS